MIAYLSGHQPDFWEPDPGVQSHRFALGSASKAAATSPPLIAIGMNSSHAAETNADKTVNQVVAASLRHGYSGWVMLNLYPERSPKPSQLSAYDPGLSALNCAAIERVLVRHDTAEVLGAWVNMPQRTLRRAKLDVQTLLDRMGVRVFTWDPLTKEGNPRHPSPPGRPLPMFGPKRYVS